MVNNDRKNCLTRIITKMARDEIQKGAVVGMYLNAFTEDDEKTIKIVSVVDEFTEAWENFKKEQKRQKTVLANVHNIKIFPSVVCASDFSKVCMYHREAVIAQELKNSYIIYDGESEWGKDEHFLKDLRESFLHDEALPFYKNHLEISPKLIKNIRQGLRPRRIHLCRNDEKAFQLSRSEESHIIDKSRLTANKKLDQITYLLLRYSIETERGLPHWDAQASSFIDQYTVCDRENFQLFQELQAKTTASKYDLGNVFNQMKQSTSISSTEEEKAEFFAKCLSYLEEGFEKIHPIDYLDGEEKEIYQKLKSMGGKK